MARKDEVVEIVGIATSIIGLIRLIVNLFGGELAVKPPKKHEKPTEQLPD